MNTIAITKPSHHTRSWRLSLAYYLFLTSGAFALVYALAAVVESHLYQAVEEARLVNASPSAMPPIPIEGNVLGQMEIPRLGLKIIVAEGVLDSVLRHAVGHIPQTAFPGESGNVALAGHRDTFLRPLRNIRQGDTINFKMVDRDFEYQVESTAVVSPTDVQVLQSSSQGTLTLVTCFPFSYIRSAPNRFIVRARQLPHPPAELTR